MDKLTAPFSYFGGKSKVGDMVWDLLGDADNFIEPFSGSLAVLLARPDHHKGHCETVNDKDLFLSNFWRAVKADPDAVAEHADWEQGSKLIADVNTDPYFYNCQVAGWWLWGINAWIGAGWCKTLSDQLPHLGNAGRGINKLPHLGNAGLGINRISPLRSGGQGEVRTAFIIDYMRALQNRLRDVRVCCGDWKRVVTDGALSNGSNIGIFLDPPYVQEGRDAVYNHETTENLHEDIIMWCKTHENNPRIKIARYRRGYFD